MTKIAILPLDDRPVNFDYPRALAEIADMDVQLPSREWLGNPWRGAQHEKLISWLRDTASVADGLIVAVDTLAYGGLIPSRSSSDMFETVTRRVEILREIKSMHSHIPIYASSVIQRVNRANSSEEEKPYWAEYGSRMFRLSYLEHKSALGEASAGEIAERDALKREIPEEVYSDYRSIRRRNHQLNQYVLTLVKEEVIDYLLLPQDDTAEYGWNIAEARLLQMLIRREGLTDRAITYPGADEIGCLLLAGFVCAANDFRPRIYPRFSSSSSGNIITEYEDRPMLELLKAHLAPLKGVIADQPGDADCILFINAPAIKQGTGELQWAAQYSKEELLQQVPESLHAHVEGMYADEYFQSTRREMQTPRRSPEEFCRAVVADLNRGRDVAIADVAFVNGSDLILGRQLVQHPGISQLAAYGGWNTAGNTLGTVLAQAAIYKLAKKQGLKLSQQKAQFEFLFLRFLDDFCYQALERSLCMLQDLPAVNLSPTEERLPNDEVITIIVEKITKRLHDQAQRLEKIFCADGRIKSVNVSNIHLPWERLFEIGFDVKVELS